MSESTSPPQVVTGPTPPGPSQVPVSEEELLKQIQEILARFEEDELCRGLCRLARDWNLREEPFRRLLVKAGMRPPRASEIKLVLSFHELRDKFLHRATWTKTLQEARDRSPGALDRAAKGLTKILEQKAHLWPEGTRHQGWLLEKFARRQFRLSSERGKLELLRALQ
jgi:hypothetical protein